MDKELSANTTLSHYRIVSRIGAGGMGEVYLAQDTKLDCRVAIKFLHEEFSKDADKLGRLIHCKPTRAMVSCLDEWDFRSEPEER